MKYILSLTLIFAFVLGSGCGTEAEEPTDFASLQKKLREKESEMRTLKSEIDKLRLEVTEKDTTEREKPRRLVTTSSIVKKDFKRFIAIQGGVQSGDAAMASSETGGRIVKMDLDEGDYVKKGQLIATLDMESIDKSIAELETSLELATDVFNRQKRLWDQNIGSEMQFLQAKNNKERIEKSIESIQFQLTKANVYAPRSGVVDMVFVSAGEMTAPGAPILEIKNNSFVKVVASVPETYLGKIKKGEMVTVEFPALNIERQGRVTKLGRTINPGNRTFAVEVNFNNGNGQLKPNLLSMMLINDFTAKDAIVLPMDLIQQEVSGRSFVYVKGTGEEGEIAKKVLVETGESYDGQIMITKGLDGTEELIMEGARGLAENELIEVKMVEAENKG